MKSIVEWLVHMEEKAESIYERSADILIDDKEFSEFLQTMPLMGKRPLKRWRKDIIQPS